MQEVLRFLTELAAHNNKEWFDDNRKWYKACREAFIQLVAEVLDGLTKEDGTLDGLEPKDCIFRINRDIRFSKDKSPYKTNFGASMAEGGRKSSHPGYYLHLSPGEHFVGGGLYMPPNDVLGKIRQEIDYNGSELKSITDAAAFKKFYGSIKGDSLTRPPKGYTADHPNIALLKLKSYIVMHDLPEEKVVAANAGAYISEVLLAMKPFKDYLDVAIS